MKKVLIIGIGVIIIIACVFFYVKGDNNLEAIITDYVNALSERNFDKLHELSGVKDLDGDTTFLAKDSFEECLDQVYGNLFISFLSNSNSNEYLRYQLYGDSNEFDKIKEEPFGDFKIQEIEYTNEKKAAVVEVYFLKYNTTERIYVKKQNNKWVIDDLANISIYENYEIKIPKGIKINKFAGVDVDKKYIVSQDQETNTYRFPKIYKMPNDIEYEFWNGIKGKDSLGFYYNSENLIEELDISLNKIEVDSVYKIKQKVVEDLKVLTNGVFDNKNFSSISNNFSKDDDLSSLEKLYNEEKKWFWENKKHKYSINYNSEEDFVDYVYIDQNTNNIVVVFLMDFESLVSNGNYFCRYAFVYNPETGKLIDLKEDSKKIMPTANRTLFNHRYMN